MVSAALGHARMPDTIDPGAWRPHGSANMLPFSPPGGFAAHVGQGFFPQATRACSSTHARLRTREPHILQQICVRIGFGGALPPAKCVFVNPSSRSRSQVPQMMPAPAMNLYTDWQPSHGPVPLHAARHDADELDGWVPTWSGPERRGRFIRDRSRLIHIRRHGLLFRRSSAPAGQGLPRTTPPLPCSTGHLCGRARRRGRRQTPLLSTRRMIAQILSRRAAPGRAWWILSLPLSGRWPTPPATRRTPRRRRMQGIILGRRSHSGPPSRACSPAPCPPPRPTSKPRRPGGPSGPWPRRVTRVRPDMVPPWHLRPTGQVGTQGPVCKAWPQTCRGADPMT